METRVNPLSAAPKPPDYLTGTETPAEIRELIHEMARHTPIVGKVLDLAEDNRFEDNEHMLLVLAHTALTAYAYILDQYLDYVNKSPIPSFVVSDLMAHVIPDKKAAETAPKCPKCDELLTKVRYPSGSMLNEEQFDATRAGDWFCKCHNNGRSRTAGAYFWDSEVLQTTVIIRHTPDPETPQHSFKTSVSHGSPGPAKRHAASTCSCGPVFTARGEDACFRAYDAWQAHALANTASPIKEP
jgi:hypothetical protein